MKGLSVLLTLLLLLLAHELSARMRRAGTLPAYEDNRPERVAAHVWTQARSTNASHNL